MEGQDVDKDFIIIGQTPQHADASLIDRWAPDEPHTQGTFVPLNTSIYKFSVLPMAYSSPAVDYSQSLATIIGRIDGLRTEVILLGAKLSQAIERAQEQPTTKLLAIHGLGSEKYKLRKPLLVTIEHYPDEVVARLSDFDIYGSGENESDALAFLRNDIVDLYEDLIESEAELGGLPASWLRDLRDYVEERTKLNG